MRVNCRGCGAASEPTLRPEVTLPISASPTKFNEPQVPESLKLLPDFLTNMSVVRMQLLQTLLAGVHVK